MRINFMWKTLTILVVFGFIPGVMTFAKEIPALQAVKIVEKEAPTIDGKIDSIWQKGTSLVFEASGDEEYEVSGKALYTDESVYFLFEWNDDDETLSRIYTFQGGKWEAHEDNEDMINLAWDIHGNIDKYPTEGCRRICHEDNDEYSSMNTKKASEKVDLWQWQSQRTNPTGYGSDQYMRNEIKSIHGIMTGRRDDQKKSGGVTVNWDEAKKRPLYVGKGKGGPFLMKGDAQKVTDSMKFTEGMVVPTEVLERPMGSLGDIQAKGVWADGKWTVELKRALKTGQGDDIQFTDLKKAYFFGVAVHNNAFEYEHATADILQLQFK